MKKSGKIGLWIALLLSVSTWSAEAQNKIQVNAFRRLETDVTARVTAPKKDQNGEVCALIRVVTAARDLMFEADRKSTRLNSSHWS